MKENSFKKVLRSAERDPFYDIAGAEINFAEMFLRTLEKKKITQKRLLKNLGESKLYWKMLRNGCDLTLADMASLARAINCEVKFRFEPKAKK